MTTSRLLRAALALALIAVLRDPAAAQQASRPLDTVLVAASRTTDGSVLRSVEVISRRDIDASPAHDVAELLANRMGVDVYGRSAAQADLSLRGGTAEQTLVLVDGVRISDVQSSHYALDLAVPLDAIERIEILRGPASALYGSDAVGGVVNIVTRRDGGNAAARTRGGAFGTFGGAASGGATSGSLSTRASAEYEKSDGFRPGTDYRIGQARVALTGRVGGGTLQGDVGVGIRDFGANDFYGPYNSTERTGSTTADARWLGAAGAWALSASASTRYHTDRFTLIRDNPAVYENLHTTWQSTGELTARRQVGAATVVVGTDGLSGQLSSARLGSRDESRGALFSEATIGSASHALLDVGLRGDQSSIFGGFLSPSLAAALRATDWLRLRGSAARGFRAPTWTERYYSDPSNIGNAGLTPEQFTSVDAGFRALMGSVTLDASGYVRRAEHLIDWVKPAGAPATTPWRATNVGTATYHGIEASLELPAWNGITSSLFGSGLDFSDAQGANLSGKYALRPISRQLGARAGFSPASEWNVSAALTQSRRASEDAYLDGSARIEWRRGRATFTLDAMNLANAGWLDASAQRVAGRALFLGAQWR